MASARTIAARGKPAMPLHWQLCADPMRSANQQHQAISGVSNAGSHNAAERPRPWPGNQGAQQPHAHHPAGEENPALPRLP